MKKIITAFFLLFSSFAFSSEVIQVVWPFSPGSTQAIQIRTLLDQANINQKKYNFVMVVKQGAGGAIAAKSVTDNNTILANSNTFFIAPAMLSSVTYDINKFSMIGEFCSNRPLGLFSTKYDKLDKNRPVTMGTGIGNILNLSSSILKANGFNITEVPFKGAVESRLAVLGGFVDYDVNFLGVITDTGLSDIKGNIIGITGKRNIGNYKTLSSQGIKGLENIVVDLFMFAPAAMDKERKQELHDIFVAAHNDKTTALCEQDVGEVTKTKFSEMDARFQNNKKIWLQYANTK